MSFGFSIGDFVAVLEIANRLRKDFSTAPKQYQAISEELRSATIVLEDVDAYLAGHDLTDNQAKRLSQVTSGFTQVLNDVERLISKHSRLDHPQTGLRSRARRVWDRASFDKDEARDLRSRMISTIGILTGLVDGFDRRKISSLVEGQTKLLSYQDKNQNREILEWLAPADYSIQHSNVANRCLAGSGQWILVHPDYIQWKNEQGRILHLRGIPGTGKTFLASAIITAIQNSKDARTAICYYYCDYSRSKDEQVIQTMLCLLRQLVQDLPELPICVRTMFEESGNGFHRPSMLMIREALRSAADQLDRVNFVIDALDEYGPGTTSRSELVKELCDLNQSTKVNILVTSRPLPDISDSLTQATTIEIRASQSDICNYISTNIHSLPGFVVRDSSLQDEIQKAILDAADGIFLLATLHLQSLKGKRSPKHLKKTLTSLGQGTSTYKEAYTRTMERISKQELGDLAIDALTWVVYAQRSLRRDELLHALAVDPGESSFDQTNIPDLNDVMIASCGLLNIEEDSGIVRLIHRTTQEFLEAEGSTWLKGHSKLSDTCRTYLAFDELINLSTLSQESFQQSLNQWPLYEYASWHGSYHTEMRETVLDMKKFAAVQQRVEDSSLTLLEKSIPEYLENSKRHPGITGLHLLAACGLTTLMPNFLSVYDVNAMDRHGRTAISYAVEKHQTEAVRLLIQSGAKVDFTFPSDNTLLTFALTQDLQSIFGLLLQGLKPPLDIAGPDGRTPLHIAAEIVSVDQVYQLIRAGAFVDPVDDQGRTPLSYAVSQDLHSSNEDREHIIRLFMENGSNPFIMDRASRTPVSYAAASWSTTRLSLLFQEGRGPSSYWSNKTLPLPPREASRLFGPDKSGMSPLMYASEAGNTDGLKLLLAAGVPVEISHITEAMHCAADSGRKDAVAFFLDLGAPIHSVNERGESLLINAVLHERIDTIKPLLELGGVDLLKIVDCKGCTVFHYASRSGFEEMVLDLLTTTARQMLERNSTKIGKLCHVPYPRIIETSSISDMLTARDHHGRSLLHMAASAGRAKCFYYLVKSCNLDPGSTDKLGKTFIDYICSGINSIEVLEQGLELNPFPTTQQVNMSSWSLWHWVCREGDLTYLDILCRAKIPWSVVSTLEPAAEWTPLDIASFHENERLVYRDGSLSPYLDWSRIESSGLVMKNSSTKQWEAVRRNRLKRASTSNLPRSSCDGCLAWRVEIAFRCLDCMNVQYCMLCRHDALSLHPEHRWERLLDKWRIVTEEESLAGSPGPSISSPEMD